MANVDPERAVGALVGLAVGDALGAPVEGVGAEDLDGKHTEMTGGGLYGLRPGQGTGDTEMALRLATSLVETGGGEPPPAPPPPPPPAPTPTPPGRPPPPARGR